MLPGAIFQQDNTRPHMARVSQDCLRTVAILPWPARSLDLSPIEHMWDHLERRAGHNTTEKRLSTPVLWDQDPGYVVAREDVGTNMTLLLQKATDHDVVGDEIENNSANPQTLVEENQHINLQKNQNIWQMLITML
ncbi:transposable element Tcb2 transposase [Trichonephila clavipes]|nr:transposable element Tcb2 transposase [Trichonephila clavipes]